MSELTLGSASHQLSVAWTVSSVVMSTAILGLRVAFAVPLELRASWLFQVIPLERASDGIVASRRALLLFGVLPHGVYSQSFSCSLRQGLLRWHILPHLHCGV